MSKLNCSFPECENPSRARGWCWPHYKQWHRGEEQRPVGSRPSAEDRFWPHVNKTETCWNWTASCIKGYGSLVVDGKNKFAHRFSYEMENGPIPAGMDIDHVCHNRACVNPGHLRATTRKQNAEHRSGAQVNSKTGVRGVYVDAATQKYIAIVNHYGKRNYVGSFRSLEEASEAVLAKRMELFTHNNVDRKAS